MQRDEPVFATELRGHDAVVCVEGELDVYSKPQFEAVLMEARAIRPTVVVDLTSCTYADTTALTVLIKMNTTLKGRLRTVIPRENRIRRVFELTGLVERLGVVGTLDEAIRED
jgi:anti-anti-sigma factor